MHTTPFILAQTSQAKTEKTVSYNLSLCSSSVFFFFGLVTCSELPIIHMCGGVWRQSRTYRDTPASGAERRAGLTEWKQSLGDGTGRGQHPSKNTQVNQSLCLLALLSFSLSPVCSLSSTVFIVLSHSYLSIFCSSILLLPCVFVSHFLWLH